MRVEGEDAGADDDNDEGILGVGGWEKTPLYTRSYVSGISQ